MTPDQVGGAFISYKDTPGWMYVARRPPGGPVGTAERLDIYGLGPWVATNARGDATAVAEMDGHFQTVYRPAGGKFGDRQKISGPLWFHPSSAHTWISLALGPDGATTYVWEEDHPDGSQTVHGTTRRPDGTIDEPAVLSTPGAFAHTPKIAADADGNLVAVWIEVDPERTEESDERGGELMASHKPHDGSFAARREIGEPTGNVQLSVSNSGQVLIVADVRDGVDGRSQLLFGRSATGSIDPPQRWGTQRWGGEQLHAGLWTNPDGDALLTSSSWLGTVHREVARKPAGATAFGSPQAVLCAPPAISDTDYALGPGGRAAAVLRVGDSTVVGTDRESPEAPTACDPGVTWQDVYPPSNGDDPSTGGGASTTPEPGFRTRLAPGGRLSRGRGVDLLTSCSAGCTVRASGSVRIKGRRGTLGFSPRSARYKRAGVKRLKLRLSKRRRAAVRRALRRGLTVRATLRVRARKASGAKSSQLIRLRLTR